jgi:hypothetical protein
MFLVFGFVLFVIRSTRVELVTLRPQSYCGQGTCYAKEKSQSTIVCKSIICKTATVEEIYKSQLFFIPIV